ncbi:MAG: DivIVA domain-containing protein [Ilumatobacteraceae bacterium]
MSPQRVRSAEFKTVRKGADPDEVRVFLSDVADELERAQNQSTAMEARARAAVARLQEVGEGGAGASTPAAAVPASVDASVDESETISRTLLLAQRTADTTVAEARREADRILAAANNESATTLDSTREMAAQLLDEARTGARQAGEAERLAVLGEVEALKARRDFLESDVEQLEIFLADQRNRVREAATSLLDIADRVPGGLGDVRAPLLSASDDDEDTGEIEIEAGDTGDQAAEVASTIEAVDTADTADTSDTSEDLLIVTEIADDTPSAADSLDDSIAADPWSDQREVRDNSDDPTEAIPVVETKRPGTDDSGGFRFSFDDERS